MQSPATDDYYCEAQQQLTVQLVQTSTIMIRRLKKDVLDQLPPKRRNKVCACCCKTYMCVSVGATLRRAVTCTGSLRTMLFPPWLPMWSASAKALQ